MLKSIATSDEPGAKEKRRRTILTSNKSLTEWAAVVQDASLAAAIVDRILHHGDVFYLNGPSYRLNGRALDDPPSASTTTTTMNSHNKNNNNNNNRTTAAPA